MADAVEHLEAHPQTPTARWLKARADIEAAAVRGATARARTDREETDRTQYHRQNEQPNPGG